METSDRELLVQLLAAQKKEVRHARITSVACLVLAALLVVGAALFLPKMLSTVDQARQTMDQVHTFLEETDGLAEDIETLVKSANRVIVDNTDAVTEAVGKLNTVDFATLNRAIQNLADAVEPLAKLGRMFS